MTVKSELVRLLQERTSNNFERRKRRLERIPGAVVLSALRKARKGEVPTLEEYVAVNCGFLPGEWPSEDAGSRRQEEQAKPSEPEES